MTHLHLLRHLIKYYILYIMKQSSIIKYKLVFVFILFIFLLIFGIYTFKKEINNESMSSNKKPINQPIIPCQCDISDSVISPQGNITQPSIAQFAQPVTTQQIIPSFTLESPIADGNYTIISDQFKNALSAYPSPVKCDSLNIKSQIFSISTEFSVTDIWTVKTVNNKTTIQQNNCNYLKLMNEDNPDVIKYIGLIDTNTQFLQTDDNPANVFYWKINKNQEDNTYSLVPYDNQAINLYNFTFIDKNNMNMVLNMFISNNNNNINNKIAKFTFNKIS
jgi:hypothetical protein